MFGSMNYGAMYQLSFWNVTLYSFKEGTEGDQSFAFWDFDFKMDI